MKHYHSCHTCGGSGIVHDSRGLGEICSACGGNGFVLYIKDTSDQKSPFLRVVVIAAIVLVLFYSLFIIYVTVERVSFTASVIILFIGHVVLAVSLIMYLLFKAMSEK